MATVTELHADCRRCAGLCCVALPFSRSADFAFDKPAGAPCPHLREQARCAIHHRLRSAGFAGCAAFDCFGAGQRVVQELFPGRDWRTDPDIAAPMFAAFAILRQLHELLWYCDEALSWPAAQPVHAELRAVAAETERLATHVLDSPDVAAHRADAVAPVLRRASRLVRGTAGIDRAGANLVEADLRHLDLRDADLRGGLLLGADLRGVALCRTDLLGADLRAADVRDADLREALFVTQMQLNGARGNARTQLPARLNRPAHWR